MFLVITAGLALRVAAVFLYANLQNPQMWAAGSIARNLASGIGYHLIGNTVNVPSAFIPPGLPFIYYAAFKLFGDGYYSYLFLLFFNCLISVPASLYIYKVGTLLYNGRAAMIALLYAAISPILIYSAVTFNSIIIYHLLIAATFYYFLKSFERKGSNTDIYKLVFVLGVFLYFRAELLILVLIISALFVLRKHYRKAMLTAAIPLIMISPWTIRNYSVFGKLVPISTSAGYNFFTGHSDEISAEEFNSASKSLVEDSTFEYKKGALGFKRGLSYMKTRPAAELKESLRKTVDLWITDRHRTSSREAVYMTVWIGTLIFFFIGLAVSLKRTEYRFKMLFLLTYLAFSTALVIAFFNLPGYQLQMSFVMIPTASFGLLQMLQMLYRRYRMKHRS